MPTKKICDLVTICVDADHTPDVSELEPGVYEHECGKCGHKERFVILIRGVKSSPSPLTPPVTIPWTQPVYPYNPNIPTIVPIYPYNGPTSAPAYPFVTCTQTAN